MSPPSGSGSSLIFPPNHLRRNTRALLAAFRCSDPHSVRERLGGDIALPHGAALRRASKAVDQARSDSADRATSFPPDQSPPATRRQSYPGLRNGAALSNARCEPTIPVVLAANHPLAPRLPA